MGEVAADGSISSPAYHWWLILCMYVCTMHSAHSPTLPNLELRCCTYNTQGTHAM